jgi:hypothetical protein
MNKIKRLRGMTAQQLFDATPEYDHPGTAPKFLKPPAALAAAEKRIRTGRGRPVIGKGSQRVTITVERALLTAANKFARARKMSRSELIALGLKLAMKNEKRSA